MTPREIAQRIVALRRMLATVHVARASGMEHVAVAALHGMDVATEGMPMTLRREPELRRRIEEPVTRRINRDGVLDTAERLREGTW